jgi:hypothetical protein
MELHVKGLVEMQRNMQVDVPKQIRYATMQTVNDCALAVQKFEIEKQLPDKFTLRSKSVPWWRPGTRYGINIRPYATRATLRAAVGSQADWLKDQEQGGIRRANGHRMAIEAGARPNETAVLTSQLKPRKLLARVGNVTVTKTGKQRVTRRNGKGFIIQTKSGPAIFIRKDGQLKLMYMLEAQARIPAILQFFESGKKVVNLMYQETFDRRFQAAMATAK